MGFILDQVVPWGRSYDEYVAMFGLTDADLKLRLLGCGDGPAAFNAELASRGGNIVSIDPIYAFDSSQIEGRIADTYPTVMAQMRENQADYVWTSIGSVDALGQIRMAAMKSFLTDYEVGKPAGRYLAGKLPALPFVDQAFDLALSSHFLFLYSTQLSLDFHIKAIAEMLRVAREARVFPLLTLDGVKSPHLPSVMGALRARGFEVEQRRVGYEFQRGGNEMLVLRNV